MLSPSGWTGRKSRIVVSLLGHSMDGMMGANWGAPGRNSSMVRRQFSKMRSKKYQRLTNLIGKEPLLLGESTQWFFQLALPTANTSYQVSLGLIPVLPAEAGLLCMKQTDFERDVLGSNSNQNKSKCGGLHALFMMQSVGKAPEV